MCPDRCDLYVISMRLLQFHVSLCADVAFPTTVRGTRDFRYFMSYLGVSIVIKTMFQFEGRAPSAAEPGCVTLLLSPLLLQLASGG